MRCAFLMTTVPGYFSVCVEALAALPGTQVMLLCEKPKEEAPFELDQVTPSRVEMRAWDSLPAAAEVLAAVEEFAPDVVMITGWQIKQFRHVALKSARKRLRVLLMDNQWLRTPKQILGVATSRLYLHPFFDIAFLPGRNQQIFARKLGFPDARIWPGAISCDHPLFAAAAEAATGVERRRSFVFVGRLVPDKGIRTLAEAYREYRERVPDPWGLEVYGAGPLAGLFDGTPGVQVKGFTQPPELAGVCSTAGCLVLPSVFEPWGTVIHEATACRLPVICSTACGGAAHLVEDGSTGYLVKPGDVGSLAGALQRMSGLDDAKRARMGSAGEVLSRSYTPEQWAESFHRRASQELDRRWPSSPATLAQHDGAR